MSAQPTIRKARIAPNPSQPKKNAARTTRDSAQTKGKRVSVVDNSYTKSLDRWITDMQQELKIAKRCGWICPWWWLSTVDFLYHYCEAWFGGGQVFLPQCDLKTNARRFASWARAMDRILQLDLEVQDEIMFEYGRKIGQDISPFLHRRKRRKRSSPENL